MPESPSRTHRPEPVAIVGMACRFPGGEGVGAVNADGLWTLMREGRDAVTEIPPERFNTRHFYHPRKDTPGRSYTFAAGVLGDVRGFDAAFFGISPREAAQLDPQQRLLLELTWEALEGAGLVPSHLRGSDTAVFLGISSTDDATVRLDDPASGDPYFMTGNTLSVAANRISHFFDFRGPSLAIDTACSSSLVALDRAHRAVSGGEVPLAVVGGVNMLLSPYSFAGFARASMLAPDGRCRPFDARGQGYVRAEGGAVLLLKPLRAAERDGDPVLAIIRGTRTNVDGHTRGISLPNGAAQEALLRTLYADAGVEPHELSYFEAHGTGTPVGDPIEAGAIARALAMHRGPGEPLLLGSVKSNIGHTEPASGLAGVAKALLVLREGWIPPSIHFQEPNPNIDFAEWNLEVVREGCPLPVPGSAPLIGVNSFGFGGANAHVILEGPPPPRRRLSGGGEGAGLAAAGRVAPGLPPLLVSARGEAALKARARDLAARLDGADDATFRAVAWTLTNRAETHPDRLLIPHAVSVAEAVGALAGFADDAPHSIPPYRATLAHDGPVGWIFTGNGAQWAGMLAEWLAEVPGAREAFAEVDAVLQPHLGWSALAYLERPADAQDMSRMEIAPPILFAAQATMVNLLKAAGARPAFVLGHSVGEIAAAYASGGMSLDDACRVIVARSTIGARTLDMGTMAAASVDADRARNWIAEAQVAVDVAGVNSPTSVTLTGTREGLETLARRAQDEGVFFRMLDLRYPYHSEAMDPCEAPLKDALIAVNPGPGEVPFYSTVSGGRFDPALLVGDYWWYNLRQPVAFESAVRAALRDARGDVTAGASAGAGAAGTGHVHTLEIGPHGILSRYLKECRAAEGVPGEDWLTGRRGVSEPKQWQGALGQSVVAALGAGIGTLQPGPFAPLPAYPWQREHHQWALTDEASPRVHGAEVHPLLGIQISADPLVFEAQIDADRIPWLRDHAVGGAVVFPAAGFIELVLAALRQRDLADAHIERLEIRRPLVLAEGQTRIVEVRLDGDPVRVRIRSRVRGSGFQWIEHAVAGVRATAHERGGAMGGGLADPGGAAGRDSVDLGRAGEPLSIETLYAEAAARGLEYGPHFRVLSRGWCEGDVAVGEFTLPWAPPHALGDFEVAPPLVDGAFHLLFGLLAQKVAGDVASGDAGGSASGASARAAYLPVAFERIERAHFPSGDLAGDEAGDATRDLARALPVPHRARARLIRRGVRTVVADFVLEDQAGRPILTLLGARFQRVELRPERDLLEALLTRTSVRLPDASDLEAGTETELVTAPETGATPPTLLDLRGCELGPEVLMTALEAALDAASGAAPSPPDTPPRTLVAVVDDAVAAAALGGLFRTLVNELAEGSETVRLQVVQVPAGAPHAELAADPVLEAALTAAAQHPGELELRLTGGGDELDPAARQLTVEGVRFEPHPALRPAPESHLQLHIPQPGRLDGLCWREVPSRALAPGEVRIRVHATGLNFRDVMWAQGLLPEEAVEDGFAGATLGMECAGEVLEVGLPASGGGARNGGGARYGVEVGDRVVAFAPSAFATEVVTRCEAVARIPEGLSFEAAATLPTTFVTAHYALHTLAGLREGEQVLIHGGAGGVGLAAIQWAQKVGAEVFATVGSPEKREVLDALGVKHILNSRDLSFVDEIRRRTAAHPGGPGVDVVLNSLAGAAMQASVELLRPFGRFLELGKRDFYLNSPLAMRGLRNNIAYHGIDADQLLSARPDLARATLEGLLSEFRTGGLTPLPFERFEAEGVVEAFRTMQQSKHVGKVVVGMDPAPERGVRVPVGRSGLPLGWEQGTVVMVGGLGGFGLEMALGLARRGVGGLVLVGRSGTVRGASGEATLDAIRGLGVEVQVVAADAAEPGTLTRLLAGIPNLAGIVHAAMVLDDRRAAELDLDSMARVWRAKMGVAREIAAALRELRARQAGAEVGGASAGDAAAAEIPSPITVVFSSATTLIGNPGQANYVAANQALEAWAEAQTEAGFPTLAVGWGPIRDAGVLTDRPEVLELLTHRLGRAPLAVAEAGDLLALLLERECTGSWAALPFSWPRIRRTLAGCADGAWTRVAEARVHEVEDQAELDFRGLASTLSDAELTEVLHEVLVEQLAQVLRVPPEQISVDRPLTELGMDSLMMMELAVTLERQFGVELPMMALSDGTTLRQVGVRILESVRGGASRVGDAGGAGRTGGAEGAVDPRQRTDDALTAQANLLAARHGVQVTEIERAQIVDSVRRGY